MKKSKMLHVGAEMRNLKVLIMDCLAVCLVVVAVSLQESKDKHLGKHYNSKAWSKLRNVSNCVTETWEHRFCWLIQIDNQSCSWQCGMQIRLLFADSSRQAESFLEYWNLEWFEKLLVSDSEIYRFFLDP